MEMNRLALIRSALTITLFSFAATAMAQHPLEIIALRHRTADQVLPSLRPLVEPGATLSGQGAQLFVRASPHNLAELRRALDAIDRPLRRLQISVRFDDAAEAASSGVEADARISNRGARVGVRAHDSTSVSAERVDQRVQVLEGSRAFISTGQSLAVMSGTAMRETMTGFDVLPRIAGREVLLEIAQRRETLSQQQALATVVSTRLAEWVEVGGVAESASRRDGTVARSSASRRIWLKVEELRQ